MKPFDDFIRVDTTPLFSSRTGKGIVCYLLWGDGVKTQQSGSGRTKVKARGGRTGWVNNSALGGESLLEIYFIDVGQGDGVLVKTPKFKHMLIDAGFPRFMQDTGKNGADFVDWKFVKDYGRKTITLDAVVASHCDADHCGGLLDLLDVTQSDELDATSVQIENFDHAGLSWWKSGNGKTLGPSKSVSGEKFWTRLLENRASALAATNSGPGPKLHGMWGDFITEFTKAKNSKGQPTSIRRLSHVQDFVPGFEANATGEPSIKILGPVEFNNNGKAMLRKFSGGNSKNTNGVSLLFRIDYGQTRTLLTGDLNKASQNSLLSDYAGSAQEFACDVAKGCHHGSDDISYPFLQAMQAGATILSSGDNEGHDHPRPSVIGASATTGFLKLDSSGDLVTPLIYSTEIARSIDLGFPTSFEERDTNDQITDTVKGKALDRSVLHIKKARRTKIRMENAMVVGGLIYGLVNIRTDGERILCATMDEKTGGWKVKTFTSRF